MELGNGKGLEEFEEHDRKSSDCLEQATSINMYLTDCASDGSEGKERSIIEKNKPSTFLEKV